jgi:hypothetical protein
MIRSLFLIAILATLVAIAFKRPEQTALEFAREVGEKTQSTVVAKLPEPLKPRSSGSDQRIALAPLPEKERELELGSRTEASVRKAEERPSASKKSASAPSSVAVILPIPRLEPSLAPAGPPPAPPLERLLLPKATTSRSIDIPAVPSAPIENVQIEPLATIERAGVNTTAKPLRLSDPDLNEVRANLENAARLLAGVK